MTRKHTSGAALHAKIGELMVYTLYPPTRAREGCPGAGDRTAHTGAVGAERAVDGPRLDQSPEKRTRGPRCANATPPRPGRGPASKSPTQIT